MALRVGQLNFSKGEIAEELIARVDVPSYSAALKQARNVIVLKYGGVTKRPGTRLVAKAHDQVFPVRLIPFQFSLTQAYALEMGQNYMRPAALGGLILETPLAITAITKAANALVSVAFHGFNLGDEIYFNDVAGMIEINGKIGKVLSTPSSGTFTVDIDTTNYSTFTGDSGGVTNTAPPPPPPPPPTSSEPDPGGGVPPPVGGGGQVTGGSGSTPPHFGGGGPALP